MDSEVSLSGIKNLHFISPSSPPPIDAAHIQDEDDDAFGDFAVAEDTYDITGLSQKLTNCSDQECDSTSYPDETCWISKRKENSNSFSDKGNITACNEIKSTETLPFSKGNSPTEVDNDVIVSQEPIERLADGTNTSITNPPPLDCVILHCDEFSDYGSAILYNNDLSSSNCESAILSKKLTENSDNLNKNLHHIVRTDLIPGEVNDVELCYGKNNNELKNSNDSVRIFSEGESFNKGKKLIGNKESENDKIDDKSELKKENENDKIDDESELKKESENDEFDDKSEPVNCLRTETKSIIFGDGVSSCSYSENLEYGDSYNYEEKITGSGITHHCEDSEFGDFESGFDEIKENCSIIEPDNASDCRCENRLVSSLTEQTKSRSSNCHNKVKEITDNECQKPLEYLKDDKTSQALSENASPIQIELKNVDSDEIEFGEFVDGGDAIIAQQKENNGEEFSQVANIKSEITIISPVNDREFANVSCNVESTVFPITCSIDSEIKNNSDITKLPDQEEDRPVENLESNARLPNQVENRPIDNLGSNNDVSQFPDQGEDWPVYSLDSNSKVVPEVGSLSNDSDDEFGNFSSNVDFATSPIADNDYENDNDFEFGDFSSVNFKSTSAKESPCGGDGDDDDDFGNFTSGTDFKSPEKSKCLELEFSDDDEDNFTSFETAFSQNTQSCEGKSLDDYNLQVNQFHSLIMRWLPVEAAAVGKDIISRKSVAKLEDVVNEDAFVWHHLEDIDSSLALKLTWPNSHTNKLFLSSLNVDARNIVSKDAMLTLFGQKWNSNVPLFAQTLSFLPLTPAKPISSESTLKPWTVEKPALPEAPLKILEFNNIQKELREPDKIIPPAQFDWSSSGLTNPLDAPACFSSLLDYKLPLANSKVVSESATRSVLTTLEKEIMSDLPQESSANSNGEKIKTQTTTAIPSPLLQKILKETTSTSTSQNTPLSTLSEDVKTVVQQLPNLNFMRSKVLMFPIRGDS